MCAGGCGRRGRGGGRDVFVGRRLLREVREGGGGEGSGAHLLLGDHVVLLLLGRRLEALPRQAASQEVHQHVAQRLEIVPPALLDAKVRVDGSVPSRAREILVLAVRDVLVRLRVAVLLRQTEVDAVDQVRLRTTRHDAVRGGGRGLLARWPGGCHSGDGVEGVRGGWRRGRRASVRGGGGARGDGCPAGAGAAGGGGGGGGGSAHQPLSLPNKRPWQTAKSAKPLSPSAPQSFSPRLEEVEDVDLRLRS